MFKITKATKIVGKHADDVMLEAAAKVTKSAKPIPIHTLNDTARDNIVNNALEGVADNGLSAGRTRLPNANNDSPRASMNLNGRRKNSERAARRQIKEARRMNQAQYDAHNYDHSNDSLYRGEGLGKQNIGPDWDAQVRNSKNVDGNTVKPYGTDIVPYVSPAEQQEKMQQEILKVRKEKMKEQASGILKEKELEDANKTGWDRFKDRFHDRAAGSRFNSTTTANRRDYNNYIHSQGRNDYIRSNKEYQRMQRKLGIHGNFDGTGEGIDALNQAYKETHKSFIQKAGEKASEVASETNFMEYLGQGWDWATQDTQHALMVAGGAVGVGILGAEILDDDDDY
jgi:hypothetical protein